MILSKERATEVSDYLFGNREALKYYNKLQHHYETGDRFPRVDDNAAEVISNLLLNLMYDNPKSGREWPEWLHRHRPVGPLDSRIILW